ncbi:hypothetical protein SSCG_05281 [Streptomyces clavuligerus]|nr:hypothetical protein SSCG_05281 [Streptomyces clavuligerus]
MTTYKTVSGVALVEERVTAGERHLTHRAAKLRGLLIIERREERGAPQNVVHEFSPCRPAQGPWPPMMPDRTVPVRHRAGPPRGTVRPPGALGK